MILDQALPDGIPKGIRVSLYDLKMHVPLVSEGTQLGDTGENMYHVSCARYPCHTREIGYPPRRIVKYILLQLVCPV